MFRCTPISAYFCGQPKIGKSHLMIKLSYDLNKLLFNVKQYVCAITMTTEHWDGYHNEPIVIFDDHYKMFDGEQKDDSTAVFNAISCTPFYPSFAHLDRKGMPFSSSILLITSNVGYPQTMYLPSALHRRHKHHFIVFKNSNILTEDFNHLSFYYAKEIIDPWKGLYIEPFSLLHDVPFSIQEFNLFPFRNLYKSVTYQQVVTIIHDDYINENVIFKNLIKLYSSK
jgi:hypothetical protein